MHAYISNGTYLLHLRTIIITIAPKRADMTDTTINVNVHPSSPDTSENQLENFKFLFCILRKFNRLELNIKDLNVM